jgi:hypothetical protein
MWRLQDVLSDLGVAEEVLVEFHLVFDVSIGHSGTSREDHDRTLT